ncbi:DevR family CRISPR-associated autoregulator [Pyrococcus yayanosii]|uniref:CRISPR-associated autoregulator, DevR family n=1 Tax=Pyrococcus yayanosii (strain CH1 / JCM 16557) TaxID=529709 RepID=F8AED2_PYRYC|nr:DevR family CRISPR-associated autoregulator [Pyrococcus yayanosii]AEH24647.1 CRISPR-associated autoregulator, DevR family [Pyrococcus yayanosii CH1]
MFLSVGVRFEANVEALNMVETAGNYSKHRRVPYLVEEDGKLKSVYVPAVSGESLAHAYQEHLVREALGMGLPVCDDCAKGEFFKSMDEVHLAPKLFLLDRVFKTVFRDVTTVSDETLRILNEELEKAKKSKKLNEEKIAQLKSYIELIQRFKNADNPRALFIQHKSVASQVIGNYMIKKNILDLSPYTIEEIIVKNCTIEDIGGFMYAGSPPVRRSSVFQVSYALPIKSMALFATAEPQLHARHAQMEGGKKGNVSEQMIYYVETGTALYGFTFNLDLDAIGVSAITSKPILDEDEIKKRREAALKALFRMLSSAQFGAKLSRFFPVGGITELVVSVTEHPFVVTSPIYDDYAEKTEKRLKVLESFGESYFYAKSSGEKLPEEVLKEAIEYIREKGHI